MKSDEIDYEIIGDDLQLIEIELDPNETVIADAGAMNYMEDDIYFDTKFGDGSNPKAGFFDKVGASIKRAITGNSIFVTHFQNRGNKKRKVAFASSFPGKIIPIDLSLVQNEIYCQKDAFLCAALGTKIDISFSKKIGRGLFGGEGFILQKLIGDGKAFLHAGGTIIKKELHGEKLRVDTGCIVGFTKDISYDIEKAGSLKSMFLGGEGLFLATLEGHGTVYLQSLPFSRLADKIISSIPSEGGKSVGEGSVLGSLGNILGD